MKKTPDAHEEPNVPSIFDVFMTSLDIVEMRGTEPLAGEPADVLVTPILPDFATMDFHRAKEAIEEGRAAVDRMGPPSSRYWLRRCCVRRRGVARARQRATSARRRSLRSAACRRRGARLISQRFSPRTCFSIWCPASALGCAEHGEERLALAELVPDHAAHHAPADRADASAVACLRTPRTDSTVATWLEGAMAWALRRRPAPARPAARADRSAIPGGAAPWRSCAPPVSAPAQDG